MAVNLILEIVVALLAGLNIFQLFSFRAFKRKYSAEAEKDEAEADADKQSALEKRIKAIEELYEAQGAEVDKLRKEILTMTTQKYESDKRNVELEAQVKMLNEKVAALETELEAYKIIAKNGK